MQATGQYTSLAQATQVSFHATSQQYTTPGQAINQYTILHPAHFFFLINISNIIDKDWFSYATLSNVMDTNNQQINFNKVLN